MHFLLHTILAEQAPYRFSIRVYKDNEEEATISEEEFAKIISEKWNGKVSDFESLDKGLVFDVVLEEATAEEGFVFFKAMKHVRDSNRDNLFPGYTFNVFFRLPVDKFEDYADEAAEAFNKNKAKMEEEEAHQLQFPDVKEMLDKLRPARRDGGFKGK